MYNFLDKAAINRIIIDNDNDIISEDVININNVVEIETGGDRHDRQRR